MSLSAYPATAKDWLQGARPHTWANAFAPVIAGTGAAAAADGAHFGRALLALVVAWALIIGVNYANDYSDGIRGTDDDRTGPQRLTGGGLARPQQVKLAAFAAFAVAGLAGIALSFAAHAWWLILVGALCIAGAWFYTGGKNPYGYRGLGEVAVFIFFGLVAVLGDVPVDRRDEAAPRPDVGKGEPGVDDPDVVGVVVTMVSAWVPAFPPMADTMGMRDDSSSLSPFSRASLSSKANSKTPEVAVSPSLLTTVRLGLPAVMAGLGLPET